MVIIFTHRPTYMTCNLTSYNGLPDVAPAFQCPTLEGPVVISRRWIEFYCSIPTNETSAEAAFNVTFLFNGEPTDKVPSIIIRPPVQRATLHEKHLSHELLGKWVTKQDGGESLVHRV